MRRALALVAVAALTLPLTACVEDPCLDLPKGTAEQVQSAKDGIELEREVGGTECVLQEDGSWEQDAG